MRARATRALARARQRLAHTRRQRDQARRVLADTLVSDLRAERSDLERHHAQDRVHTLEVELQASQEAVANLVQRVAQERRRWKAALLSDRRRSDSRRSRTKGAEERRLKALEADLAAEQEAVVNLLDRNLQERRRWKAAILSVRRHLLKVKRRPSAQALEKLASVERDLEQSREACANLMVELTAQRRSGQARLASLERRARKGRPSASSAPKKAPEKMVIENAMPLVATADLLGASLRRLAESQADQADEPEPVAEASRREARAVVLSALASTPPRPTSGNLRAAVVRRLTAWEPAFRAKGFSIIPPDGPGWAKALFEGSVIQTILDELLSIILARMPRAGALIVKGSRRATGVLAVEFICGGAAPDLETYASETGLPLARAIAKAWGGDLEIGPGPRGRGKHIVLTLVAE